MEKLTLLLDGDVFAYQAALSSECAIQWDENTHTLDANLPQAIATLEDRIASIKKKLEADFVIVTLSDTGSGYWRRRILPTYKMNRKATRKPIVLKQLRDHLISKYYAKLKPMLEGDDVMGILATHPSLVPGRKYIVSVDKDMMTIPGVFCRNLNDNLEIHKISEEEADYWHMYQTLIGDTSDGYTGCPGIGPKNAHKILDGKKGIEQMWEAVVATYKKKNLNEDSALIQARVARILRHTDYDFKTKLPILWTPPVLNTKGNDELGNSKQNNA